MSGPRVDDPKLSLYARLRDQGRTPEEAEAVVARVFAPAEPVSPADAQRIDPAAFAFEAGAVRAIPGAESMMATIGAAMTPSSYRGNFLRNVAAAGRDVATRFDEARTAAPGRYGAGVAGGVAAQLLTNAPSLAAQAPAAMQGATRAVDAALAARPLWQQAAAMGAGAGALDARTVEDVPSGAALGGALGTGLAALGAGVAKVAPSVVRGVQATGRAVRAGGDMARAQLTNTPRTVQPTALDLARADVTAVRPDAMPTPTLAKADRLLAEYADADQKTLSELARMAAQDESFMLADAGEQLGAAQAYAANTPSDGASVLREALKARQANATDAMTKTIERQGPTDALGNRRSLIENLNVKAKQFYDEARAHGRLKKPATLRAFLDLMDRSQYAPLYRQAYAIGRRQAIEEARLNGLPNPFPEEFADPSALPVPDVNTADLIKRGLDAVIEGKAGGTSVARNEARLLKQGLEQFKKAVDKEVPAYAKARKMYGGDAAVISALETGRTLYGQPLSKVRDALQDVSSAAEREAIRMGYGEGLLDAIARKGGYDNAALVLKSKAARESLRAIYGPRKADAIIRDADTWGVRSDRFRRALGNSETQPRQQVARDIEGQNLEAVRDVANPAALGMRAVGAGLDFLSRRAVRGNAGDISQRMALQGDQLAAYLRFLDRALAQEAAQQQRAAQAARTLSARAGGAAAATTSP